MLTHCESKENHQREPGSEKKQQEFDPPFGHTALTGVGMETTVEDRRPSHDERPAVSDGTESPSIRHFDGADRISAPAGDYTRRSSTPGTGSVSKTPNPLPPRPPPTPLLYDYGRLRPNEIVRMPVAQIADWRSSPSESVHPPKAHPSPSKTAAKPTPITTDTLAGKEDDSPVSPLSSVPSSASATNSRRTSDNSNASATPGKASPVHNRSSTTRNSPAPRSLLIADLFSKDPGTTLDSSGAGSERPSRQTVRLTFNDKLKPQQRTPKSAPSQDPSATPTSSSSDRRPSLPPSNSGETKGPGRPRKNKSGTKPRNKLDNAQAARVGGVYVPASLVNPFNKRARENDPGLRDDIDLIRVESGNSFCEADESPSPSCLSITGVDAQRRGSQSRTPPVDQQKMKDTRASSPARHSSRLEIMKPMPFDDQDEAKPAFINDDHCSACLGRGRLLCCESCPRSFHFVCVEEGFAGIEDAPEGIWECKSCRAKKVYKGHIAGDGSDLYDDALTCDFHQSSFPESRKGKDRKLRSSSLPLKHQGLFDELLYTLDGTNPKMFELPIEVFSDFENVFRHPVSGDYVDTREYDISRHPRGSKGAARRTSSAATEVAVPLKSYCFKCGKSGIKINPAAYLSSFSVPQSTSVARPQAVSTDLIKCDYCPLYWHLDCLDPPLTNVPPELREEEWENVDVNIVNSLRIRTWGPEGSLYEELMEIPFKDGEDKQAKKTDLGILVMRKKWMCPCHVEWSLPKMRVSKSWRWVEVSEERYDEHSGRGGKRLGEILEKKPGKKIKDEVLSNSSSPGHVRPDEALNSRLDTSLASTSPKKHERISTPTPAGPPPVEKVLSSRNNGYIDVINEPSTAAYFSPPHASTDKPKKRPVRKYKCFEINGIKYKVPERRIKLDFLDRVQSLSELYDASTPNDLTTETAQKLQGFYGNHGHSNIGELYDAAGRALLGSFEGQVPSSFDGLGGLLAATRVIENRKVDGTMRASTDEIKDWLEAVVKMQSEVAVLLTARQSVLSSAASPKSGLWTFGNAYGVQQDATDATNSQTDNDGTLTADTNKDTETAPDGTDRKAPMVVYPDDPDWIAFMEWKRQHQHAQVQQEGQATDG
ncbi:hypothetical protein HDU85_006765 [Gaertneriomyces sp. JEL0708]|nr:hypothetical protein HDU85_006765 [Gaertneriomyces sp. JEL0708]